MYGSKNAVSHSFIRRWPYPYDSLIAFAPDADDQNPHWAAEFHKFLSGLGLDVANSTFVNVGFSSLNGFFCNGELNQNLDECGLPAWYKIVRDWHRGTIDHFHSWDIDSFPLLNLEYQLVIENQEWLLSFPDFQFIYPEHAKNYLSLRLFLREGAAVKNVRFKVKGSDIVCDHWKVFSDQSESDFKQVLEIDLKSLYQKNNGFRFSKNAKLVLDFERKAATEECLQKIQLASFCRSWVSQQLEFLKKWQIHPALYTSHGGENWETCCVAIGNEKTRKKARRQNLAQAAALDSDYQALANAKGSWFNMDQVFNELGIDFIVPICADEPMDLFQLWNDKRGEPRAFDDRSYQIKRTSLKSHATSSKAKFVESLRELEPLLQEQELSEVYINDAKWGVFSQGVMLPLLIQVGLQHLKAEQAVEHLWYTHWGSLEKDSRRSDFVVSDVVKVWIEKLAQVRRKVWIAKSSVVSRYERMRGVARTQLHVNFDFNEVRWKSKRDTVLGKVFPDLKFSQRDLAGLTCFVSDARVARFFIDDHEIFNFTRNEKEQSITVVDDRRAQWILGGLDPRLNGKSIETGLSLDFEKKIRLNILEDSAQWVYQPDDEHCWDERYLGVHLKGFTGEAIVVKIQFENGFLWQKPIFSSDREQFFRLEDSDQEAHAVYRGRIQSVAFDFKNLKGQTVSVLAIRAISGDASSAPSDCHIVAGCIHGYKELKDKNIQIRARFSNAERFIPIDQHGIYVIESIPHGCDLLVQLIDQDQMVQAQRHLYVSKNFVEADFRVCE